MSTEPNLTGLQTTLRQVRDEIEDNVPLMDYQAVQAEMSAAANALDTLYRAVRITKLHMARENATSQVREIDAEFRSLGLDGSHIAVTWC